MYILINILKSMCYTLKASINTSIIGLVSSFILYNKTSDVSNKYSKIFKVLALFFTFVTLMQIYDVIFWKSLEYDNVGGKTQINFLFTKIAMITNHLQPLVLAYLINTIIPLNTVSKFMVLIYTILGIVFSIRAFNKISYTVVTETSSPSLYWEWNNFDKSYFGYLVYTVFLMTFAVLCFQLDYPINIVMMLFNFFTFFLAKYKYKASGVGRFWCVFAAYIPLVLSIIN